MKTINYNRCAIKYYVCFYDAVAEGLKLTWTVTFYEMTGALSPFMIKCIYPSYFKLHVCWLRQFTPVTYFSKLLGINERLLPLTGGQPSAGQIRSRRICHFLAALLGLWPRPFGASASAVQGTSALSCNSNYLGYRLWLYCDYVSSEPAWAESTQGMTVCWVMLSNDSISESLFLSFTGDGIFLNERMQISPCATTMFMSEILIIISSLLHVLILA